MLVTVNRSLMALSKPFMHKAESYEEARVAKILKPRTRSNDTNREISKYLLI